MARAYTVATIALALRTTPKWVDNALSHFRLSGVAQGTQGVSRKIASSGVLELATAQSLSHSLQIPLGEAIVISRRLLESGEYAVTDHLKLQLDRETHGNAVAKRLEFAVEAAPLPRRGRPRGKTKRGA
jgi:hypothetical protein